MRFGVSRLFSGFVMASALLMPAAQAQEAAPEDLPLFVWLNSLVAETPANAEPGEVTVKPLNDLKIESKPAATGHKRKANQKIWVSKSSKSTHKTGARGLASRTAAEKPGEPPLVVATATPPAAKPRQKPKATIVATNKPGAPKPGETNPRVYTLADIFSSLGTRETPEGAPDTPEAGVKASQQGIIAIASLAPLKPATAKTAARTKKKVNMKTWKSHAKKAAVSRKPATPGIDPKFVRKHVSYKTDYAKGTIVVDTSTRYLYLVEGDGKAVRYGIGVGRLGFTWKGTAKINRKAKWPAWHPPAEMRKREPWLPVRMEGGEENPLGARALYLYKGGKDTLYRIHGTNQPETIGQAVSSGCIRLTNDDISDLYSRTPRGVKVVVL